MSELNIALTAVGSLVLMLGLLSGLIRRSILSEPLVALLVGVLLGPAALGLLDPAEEERVQEAVNRFFILPIFVLLGLTIPWEGWLELGWAGLLLALAVLLLRRLPAVLALKPLLGRVRGARDALFLGWFGPIGVAALYYANLSVSEAGVEEAWVIGSLIICSSILVHGLSATPLTKLYGRWAGSD